MRGPLVCDAESDSDAESGMVPLLWDSATADGVLLALHSSTDGVSVPLGSQLANVSVPLLSDTDNAEHVAVVLLLSTDTVASDVLDDVSLSAWPRSGTDIPPDSVTLRASDERPTAHCL